MDRMTKECTECSVKVGRNSRSLLCDKHLKSRYYSNNKAKSNLFAKKWREDNPGRAKENREKWKKNNPERHKINRDRYFYSIEGRFKYSKRHAKYKKRAWLITLEDFRGIDKKPCHYCGTNKKSVGSGIDRIDNSKGYIIGNILPCCGPCNSIRGIHLTSEEMRVAISSVILYRKCVEDPLGTIACT